MLEGTNESRIQRARRHTVSRSDATLVLATGSATMLPRLLAAYRKYGFAAAGCPDSANHRCSKGAPVDSMKNGAPSETVSSAASHQTGISEPVGCQPDA